MAKTVRKGLESHESVAMLDLAFTAQVKDSDRVCTGGFKVTIKQNMYFKEKRRGKCYKNDVYRKQFLKFVCQTSSITLEMSRATGCYQDDNAGYTKPFRNIAKIERNASHTSINQTLKKFCR